MPGFFGVVDSLPVASEPRQLELKELVRRMSKAMRYESTYSENAISCPAVGAYVGHVNLQDDEVAHSASVCDGVIVVTAGSTGPGAHAVAVAYERGGEEGVIEAAGGDAVFVADRTRRICLLVTDRYGRDRVFLYSNGTRVIFASEAKAILAVVPETRALDTTGLAELFACGCTLGSQSLFRRIEVLPGGTSLTFNGSNVVRRRYFDRACLEQSEQSTSEAFLEGFAHSLNTAVTVGVRSAPTVGISITGGLDSRMIMASLDAPEGSVPCYTFGSMYRTTGDVAVGRRVAARCGQPHHVVELGRDFLTGARETLEQAVYISDGYLGLSGAAELYVNRQARRIAPARMTGNWGGELMRGVRSFKYTVPKGDFVVPELVAQMHASAAAFSTTGSHPLSAALFQQLPFQGYGRFAIERSQVVMRAPFLADDVVKWLYRAPADIRSSIACATDVIGRRPDLLTIPTDLGLLGSRPSRIRRAARKALIKAEYLTSHGAPNWLARLAANLPAAALEMRFLGVDKFHHFRFWTRRDLAGLVRETLLSDSGRSLLRTWFDVRRVENMVNEHIDGHANHTDAIDKLLMVVLTGKTLLTAERFGSERFNTERINTERINNVGPVGF
jgi:asparagine synthase (glutamine-hydrolysing)